MPTPVTDPNVLAQLNGGAAAGPQPVTDPAILAQLDGAAPVAAPAQPAADPYAAPGGVTGGAIFRGVTQAARGFNHGLGSTVGRAADAATNLVNYPAALITGNEQPAQHLFENLLSNAGNVPAPVSTSDKALSAGGEMAGANVPLLGASLVGAASRPLVQGAAEMAPGVLGKLRFIADAMQRRAASAPIGTAAGDTGAALLAGTSGEVQRQGAERAGVGETGQHVAEVAGQSLEPILATLYSKFAPTRMAARGGQYLIEQGARALPESMTPSWLKSDARTIEQRGADQLGFANREGKFADPNVPNPETTSWLARQQDAGEAKRVGDAKAVVSKEFDQVVSRPESAANLAEAARLQKEIPGFKPGVAKATGDQALLNLQEKVAGESTGNDLRNLQQNTDESRGAIQRYRDAQVPPVEAPREGDNVFGAKPGAKPPQDIVADTVAGRLKSINQRIGQQRTAAETNLGERTDKLQSGLATEAADTQAQIEGRQSAAVDRAGQQEADATGRIRTTSDSLPEVDRVEGGQALRESRDAAQRAMDAETTRLRANIADPHTQIELAPAVAATETTAAQPAVIVSLNQALNRRASINSEMRDYMTASNRDVNDVRAMRNLQRERDDLDHAIEGVSDQVGGLREYATHYAKENVPQFRQGASADVGRRDSFGYGGNRVNDEHVAGTFFKPNEESAAAQFETSQGHDPAARKAMVDNALEDIRHNGTDPTTGLIKEGFVAKWLQKNERILAKMPDTGAEIRAAVGARNPDADYAAAATARGQQKLAGNPKTLGQVDTEVPALQSKAATLAEQQKLAGNPKTAGQLDTNLDVLHARLGDLAKRQADVADVKVAKMLGKTPEKQIDAGLNDWQVMRGLKASVRHDPQALAALQRAVWERAPNIDNPAELQKWIDGRRRSLSQVLTPEHLTALDNIVKAAQIQNRLPRPTGAVDKLGTMADRAARETGLSVQGFLSRALNVAKGFMSKEYAAADIGIRWWHNHADKAVDAAWREALTNPKVAGDLSMISRNKSATPIQLNRLYNYLLTVGAVDAGGEDKPK